MAKKRQKMADLRHILKIILRIALIGAYMKKKDDLSEELADVVIYLLGLAEILGFELEDELTKKFEKIKKKVRRGTFENRF